MIPEQNTYTAKTLLGLEHVLAEEIRALGGENIRVSRRLVLFDGDTELMYAANYCVRTAISILVPIHSFKAENDQQLYDGVRKIKWEDILTTKKTFMIHPTVRSEHFTHSQYAALKTKDAIVDYFRDKFGERPSVDTSRPDVSVDLNIRNKQVTISLNSSGRPLFMRGYRKTTGEAPINEVLAAGMIQLSGWDKKTPFLDPMCGSGTLAIEAAMLAANVPAGFQRRFYGFFRWNSFDKQLWDGVKHLANSKIKDHIPRIKGSDASMAMIKKARINASELSDVIKISFNEEKLQDQMAPIPGTMIIFNPPYGERMNEMIGISDYKELGDYMKSKFKGCTVWIITSDRDEIKHIGLKTSKRINLMNGPLDCTFRKFDLY